MTKSDWQTLRVQLGTSVFASQLHQWLEKLEKDKLKELLSADKNDTATHEQLIGEMRSYHGLLPKFIIFVENQIRDSKEEEQQS